ALNIQLSSLSSLDVYGGNSDAQDLTPFNDSSLHIDEFLIHLEKILLSSDSLSSSVSVSTQDWNNIVRDCHSYHLKCLNIASGKQVAVSDCKTTAEELELRMKEKVGDLLCIDAKSIDINQPMLNYGIDSLMSVEMVTWASREWGAVISQLDILGGVTTKALIDSAMNKKMAVSAEIKIDIFSK
ncbi:acyl carrier protein, partial [Salmonella sp. s55004]|uniref:acyl carrier protein n=1 Tax=Salmonella sp. s55004 TaxID=3159675 RepID=UPI0039806223